MKKLNNRGWGLSTFLFYLGIFCVFIIIVTILAISTSKKFGRDVTPEGEEINNSVNIPENNQEENNGFDYKKIEDKLINAAHQYQLEYLPSINDNDIKYVSSTKLQNLEFLDNLTDGEVLCTGYVKIFSDNQKVDFVPFINCGDYITEGYNEELDK